MDDLRDFKESVLGHAILDDNVPDELNELGIEQIAVGVREVLKRLS